MVVMVMGMVMLMVMVITWQIQLKQMKYGCRGSRLVRLISKVQNHQCPIGSEISHIKHCDWSSQQCTKASRNLIEHNAVAAYFIMLGNLADVSAWGLDSESNFAFS